MKNKYWNIAIILYLLIYVLICINIGKFTNYHVALNDFWGNLYISDSLDFSNPQSFYNGFFPVGYSIFLKILSIGNPIKLAYLANIFLGLLMLGSIAYLISVMVGSSWAFLGTITLSLLPKIFAYITLPGPDIGTAAFITVGATILIISIAVKFENNQKDKLIIIAGVCFGLSALWRYHGLVLSLGFIGSTAIISGSPLRYIRFSFSSMLLVYSLQMLLNIMSGHGLLETATNFNVYISMYGVNWYKISAIVENIPKSSLEIILNSPIRFLKIYFSIISKYITFFIPFLLGIFILRRKEHVKTSKLLIMSFTFYIFVVSTGARFSSRVEIPLMPFVIYQIIVLSEFIYKTACNLLKDKRLQILVILSVFILVTNLFLYDFLHKNYREITQRRATNKIYQAVEELLVEEGVDNSKQVFTTSFNLYFPNLKPYSPYKSGGWPRYSLYKYNQKYPILSVESIDDFLEDCKTNAITHLVLGKNASVLLTELGQIYTGELKSEQLQLSKIIDIHGFKVFEIRK